MGKEDQQPNKPENQEFIFPNEKVIREEQQKIIDSLAPFLGESIAGQTGEYLLDAANRMNSALEKILSNATVKNDFIYTGDFFKNKKKFSIKPARNGFAMLRVINNSILSYYFGTNKPTEPNPEIYGKNLQKMLEWLSDAYIDPVIRLTEWLDRTGTIESNFTPEGVSGDEPKSKKQEASEAILKSQKEAEIVEKIKNDPFFQDYERQMKEDEE